MGSPRRTDGLRKLGTEFLEALQPRQELRRRAGVADAQRARFAEGGTGDASHALAFEQDVAEVEIVGDLLAARLVRLAEGEGDVREHVERPLRARAHEAG